MTTGTGPLETLDALDRALDALIGADLVGPSPDQLLEVTRRFERFRRRMAMVDHRLVAEVEGRGVAAELCVTSTAALLRQVLRISPREATARVRAAAVAAR